MYDPIERTKTFEKIAVKDGKRGYYRFRPAKWYGGIITGDVTVCNLLCAFCWAGDDIRHHPQKVSEYFTAEESFSKLDKIGRKCGYKQIRLSGQEPTIGKEHLLELLKLIDQTEYTFILETNGILIGYNTNYAKDLAKFGNLQVRVSLKGTNETEFTKLTGAIPEAYNLQLKALENLVDAGVSCHPAVIVSFSEESALRKLGERLAAISPDLKRNLEIEELILYPHVVNRLKKLNLKFNRGYAPNNVPKELI